MKVYRVPQITMGDAYFTNGFELAGTVTIAAGIKSAVVAGIKVGIKGTVLVAVPGPA